jgi:hypothetical protein
LGPASPILASHRNEIRVFAFSSVYDRFHSRTMYDARLSLNAFLAEPLS